MNEQGIPGGQLRAPDRGRFLHSHPVDALLFLLLVVGFFLAPLKLLGTSWFSYLGADGLAVIVLLTVLAERIGSRKPLIAASPLSIPILLLAAYCILEVANPSAPFVRSTVGLRSWLLYLAFYFVGLYTFRSVRQVDRLYALLITLGFLTAVYGVYQWHAGPQSFANWSDYYGQYARLTWIARSGAVFRAFSVYVNPGAFGGNMVLLMLLAFGVAASPRIGARWRIACAIAFVAMGAGIAVSGSRGPVVSLMLAAAVALALIPGLRPRVVTLLKAVGMTAVAAILATSLIGSVIGERFGTIFDPQAFFWKWFGPLSYGLQVALEHPFGMGLGYTAGVPQFILNPAFKGLPTRNIDSGYGSAAAELGLIGLAVFIFFALRVGVEGFRAWKGMPSGRLRDLLLGPALFAATYPIVSLIGQPQATLPSSIYFWLLVGMLMKAPMLQRALDADQLLPSEVHSGE